MLESASLNSDERPTAAKEPLIQSLRSEIDNARKGVQEIRSRLQPIVSAIAGTAAPQPGNGLTVVSATGGAVADLTALNADIRSIFELLDRIS
jgi:hypothetical protein